MHFSIAWQLYSLNNIQFKVLFFKPVYRTPCVRVSDRFQLKMILLQENNFKLNLMKENFDQNSIIASHFPINSKNSAETNTINWCTIDFRLFFHIVFFKPIDILSVQKA